MLECSAEVSVAFATASDFWPLSLDLRDLRTPLCVTFVFVICGLAIGFGEAIVGSITSLPDC